MLPLLLLAVRLPDCSQLELHSLPLDLARSVCLPPGSRHEPDTVAAGEVGCGDWRTPLGQNCQSVVALGKFDALHTGHRYALCLFV